MRLHYQSLILLLLGCALAEPAWAAPSMPVPELKAPERGSLAGSLSRVSYGPADLVRGAFMLPGPFEAPQERGPLLARVFPSYSPEAGLSEWGMGWNTNLAIVRTAVVGDIDYEADKFASPWGLLAAGDDGHYYPAGMRAAVRLTRDTGGWTAVLADGTRLAFTHRVDTWTGTYAWYLRVAVNPLGDRTDITYHNRVSNRRRPYVSEVSHGGRGRTDYRLRFEYEALSWPFTSYLSGHAWTLDKRVRAVHVEAKHAHSGRFEPRWRYELAYEKSPLGPAFYLASVTRVYASGAEEPASRYTYDLGVAPLDTATFAHVPALDPFTTTGHSLRMASFVDLDRDSMVDLEHPTYYKRFRLVDGTWQGFPLYEARKPFRHCRNEPDMLNQPRLLAYLMPEARSAQVIVRYRHRDGTRLILCTEEGWRIMEFELREDWRGAPLVDMNRDLRPELVRIERGKLQMVRNLSGRGDFDFFESFGRPLLPAFTPDALWTVDVNGDGIVDIVGRNSNKLLVWYGQGDYGFVKQGHELRLYTPTNQLPVSIAAESGRLYFVDLNRDGLADALLTDKSRVRVFYNQGDRFLEHRVKALDPLPREAVVTNGVGEALAAVADLTGDGNVDFLYQHAWKAWALSLVRNGTGLLQAADDGKGTVLEFRYGRAKPQPGVQERPAVLSELVVSVSGKEPVTYRYEYEQPIVHSRGRFLIGYAHIRRIGPALEEDVWLRHDDDIAGVVEAVTQRDKSTPGLERYVKRLFTEQHFAGVRWLRPEFEQAGWRQDGQNPQRGTTITTLRKAFEAGGRCPTRSVVLGPSGELVRETIRASIPALGDALHCLSSFERETGRHADAAHDFMQEQEILRNAHGQVTEVRQVGDGEMLTAYRVEYDAARRARAVHQPGRGAAQIAYDDRTGLIREIVSADGVVRRVSARDPVSDAFTSLADDRGPGGVLTSFYRYDPFERLEASWQDFGGSTAVMPLTMLRYVYPSRAGPGAVLERALVDAARGIVRDQVDYVAADGTPLGTATRIPQGWAFSEVRAYDDHNHTELLYRRPVRPSSQEPMYLGYGDLYGTDTVMLRRTETTGFDDVAKAWTTVQQDVLHAVHRVRAVVDGLLVTTTVENRAHATAMATDGAGQVRWIRDEVGAITYFHYDVAGRLVRVELPDGQVQRAHYDSYGRLARIERDDVGAIAYEYAPSTGLLAAKQVIGANGAIERTVAYAYDAAGRLVRETYTQAGASESRTVEYEYDGGPGQRGRLTRVRGAQHEAWFRYNPDGTVAHTVIELAGWRSASIDIEYYAGGQIRRTKRVIRDLQHDGAILEELTQDFLYDSHGRLHALIVNGNQLATIVYDAEGRIDRIQLASGDMVVYSYDRVTHQPNAYWHDAGEWNAGVEWTLDARGHITREAFSVNGTYRNRDYLYDPRGFLTQSADDSHTARYSYTAAGLLATAEDELGLRTVHRGTAQSLLVGNTTYEYDDLGRVIRKGDIELAYGPDGHLAVARRGDDEWTYYHDEHGNRLLKLHNGQPVTAYLDGSYITANRIITPVHIAGRLIGVLEGSQFHLLAVDPRGTVLSDRDGTPRPASPYGVRTTRPDLAEALDYVEASYDSVLGTVRMGVRDYDPILGQFWTPDPLYFAAPELCADDPAQCNLYSYASNNPLSFIDPSGLGPDLFQRSESLSYCDFNPVQCQAASGPTVGELARRGYDLGGQIAVNIAYGVLTTLFCGYECSEAGENAASSKGPLDDLRDAAVTGFAFTSPFKGTRGDPRGTAATSVDDAASTVIVSGLGVKNTSIALRSASQPYKGTTRLGHALSKHAGRNPELWGKVTGNPSTWHQQALQHFRDIFRGPGSFTRMTDPKTGLQWIEKVLPDGRGIRLNLDYTFKGFLN